MHRSCEAYNGDLDKEVRAQLILAYHKDPTNQKCGIISNNQAGVEDQDHDVAGSHRREK